MVEIVDAKMGLLERSGDYDRAPRKSFNEVFIRVLMIECFHSFIRFASVIPDRQGSRWSLFFGHYIHISYYYIVPIDFLLRIFYINMFPRSNVSYQFETSLGRLLHDHILFLLGNIGHCVI